MVMRRRSPNYPSIDLGKAVERTKTLYKQVERGEFNALDAAKAWGYRGENGISRGAMAALRQYGLIEQKKGDNANLAARGLTIALRDPASTDYQRAVQQAAMEPPLFEELFTSGKANAAKDALRQFLVVDKGFTNDGASRLIAVLDATKALAHIGENGIISGQTDGSESTETLADETSTREKSRESGEGEEPLLSPDHAWVPLRLTGGYEAAIELPSSMTDGAWRHMLRILSVMKDGYVVEPAAQHGEDDARLSDEAEALLRQVAGGGVPMYITNQFRAIAEQHGIEVTGDTTPNDVIDQLKAMR